MNENMNLKKALSMNSFLSSYSIHLIQVSKHRYVDDIYIYYDITSEYKDIYQKYVCIMILINMNLITIMMMK